MDTTVTAKGVPANVDDREDADKHPTSMSLLTSEIPLSGERVTRSPSATFRQGPDGGEVGFFPRLDGVECDVEGHQCHSISHLARPLLSFAPTWRSWNPPLGSVVRYSVFRLILHPQKVAIFIDKQLISRILPMLPVKSPSKCGDARMDFPEGSGNSDPHLIHPRRIPRFPH